MSGPENFLQRWSRRKIASEEAPTAEPEQTKGEGPRQEATDDVPIPAAARHEVAAAAHDDAASFDPTSLPPVDSINAASDVSAFLRSGVPPDLTRAALRRAWTSDPAIRDFIGLVENGWDFNDPDAMAGFGAISVEEVARLASRLVAQLPEPVDRVTPAASGEGKEQLLRQVAGNPGGTAVLPDSAESSRDGQNDAVQQKSGG
jgi:uncharacterized protein DUF3306